jgi:hypothetical protein
LKFAYLYSTVFVRPKADTLSHTGPSTNSVERKKKMALANPLGAGLVIVFCSLLASGAARPQTQDSDGSSCDDLADLGYQ